MKATGAVQLISVGRVPAIAAEDLRVGMYSRFNYGSHEQIVTIEPKGNLSLIVTVRLKADGRLFSRTVRRTTLMAVVTNRELDVTIDTVP